MWTSKTLEKEGKLPSNQCFSGLGDRKRESGAVWGAGKEGGPIPLFLFWSSRIAGEIVTGYFKQWKTKALGKDATSKTLYSA